MTDSWINMGDLDPGLVEAAAGFPEWIEDIADALMTEYEQSCTDHVHDGTWAGLKPAEVLGKRVP